MINKIIIIRYVYENKIIFNNNYLKMMKATNKFSRRKLETDDNLFTKVENVKFEVIYNFLWTLTCIIKLFMHKTIPHLQGIKQFPICKEKQFTQTLHLYVDKKIVYYYTKERFNKNIK